MSTHEEIEELLESHLMDCNSLGEKISYLLVTIQNSEDLVRLLPSVCFSVCVFACLPAFLSAYIVCLRVFLSVCVVDLKQFTDSI